MGNEHSDTERTETPAFLHFYLVDNIYFRTIAAECVDTDRTDFTVRCDAVHNRQWKCEADVILKQLRASGIRENICEKVRF